MVMWDFPDISRLYYMAQATSGQTACFDWPEMRHVPVHNFPVMDLYITGLRVPC